MSLPRLCRLSGLGMLAALATVTLTPVPNLVARAVGASAPLGRADAIVVLGASVRVDGSLGDVSLRRTVHGILLYRRGLAPLLVVAGADRQGPRTEAAARAELARALGVPAAAIVTSAEGRTTWEEARRIGAWLRDRGLRRALLVTGTLHMPRAADVFARAGVDVVPAPVDDVEPGASAPEARLQLSRELATSLLGRLYYRLTGSLAAG